MKTVLLCLLLCPFCAWAQFVNVSQEDLQRKQSFLLLRDGSVVRGQIVRQDSALITVQVRKGVFSYVESDQIVSITPTRPGYSERKHQPLTIFVLKDSTRLPGTFVRQDSTMITVRKQNGQLTYFEPELLVRTDTAQSENQVDTASETRTFANRFPAFLLANPTAFNLEKRRFYYRNTLVALNELDYGITNHWSVGAGLSPMFNDLKIDNWSVFVPTYRFTTKLSVPIGGQIRVGVNAIYQPKQRGDSFYIAEQVIVQGMVSLGNSQRNATIGYGMRISSNSRTYSSGYAYFYANKLPFVSIGVMHKISRNLTFLSDNTMYINSYFRGNGADVSAALRLNRRRHAFDIGAISTMQSYTFYRTNSSGNRIRAYFYPFLGYKLLLGKD